MWEFKLRREDIKHQSDIVHHFHSAIGEQITNMKIEMMTLSKLVMIMMMIMITLSDTVSRGESERKARQNDEDVAKEGDFALIILEIFIRKYEGRN